MHCLSVRGVPARASVSGRCESWSAGRKSSVPDSQSRGAMDNELLPSGLTIVPHARRPIMSSHIATSPRGPPFRHEITKIVALCFRDVACRGLLDASGAATESHCDDNARLRIGGWPALRPFPLDRLIPTLATGGTRGEARFSCVKWFTVSRVWDITENCFWSFRHRSVGALPLQALYFDGNLILLYYGVALWCSKRKIIEDEIFLTEVWRNIVARGKLIVKLFYPREG